MTSKINLRAVKEFVTCSVQCGVCRQCETNRTSKDSDISQAPFHGHSQDFDRVGVPRGGCRISGSGVMEGPKAARARRVGAKRRSAERVGYGEGRRSPSPGWESGGIVPRKIFEI